MVGPAHELLALAADRWPFWAGGLAIGTIVVALLLGSRNLLGVSGGLADACAAPLDPRARRSWRLPFLLGIVGGGFIAALSSGAFAPSFAMGSFDTRVTAALVPKLLVFFGGGALLGFGARLANGCTSGHGIVGVALLARASLIATAVFMVTGFVIAQLIARGGA